MGSYNTGMKPTTAPPKLLSVQSEWPKWQAVASSLNLLANWPEQLNPIGHYGFGLTTGKSVEIVSPSGSMQCAPGLAIVPELAVIQIEGPDSTNFLQGQVTNDVAKLAVGEHCLAGFCTAKGRLLASFIVLRRSEECFWLLTSAPLAQGLAKRLSMFVLRAKCKVTSMHEQLAVIAALSADVPQTSVVEHWIKLDASLAFGFCDIDQLSEFVGQVASKGHFIIDSSAWLVQSSLLGLPWITPLTSELFVPQMVNFDLIEGVNFKKGCYPGQEIVARTHYLGKVKRRTRLFSLEIGKSLSRTTIVPGQDVWAVDALDQNLDLEPIGQVVQAAVAEFNGESVLIALVESNTLTPTPLEIRDPADRSVRLQLQPAQTPYSVLPSET